ncbi:hypothetical protein [Streptomyces phaeochromogenes]
MTQPCGVDGVGVEEALQPDPAQLSDDRDGHIARLDVRTYVAVGDSGGDDVGARAVERAPASRPWTGSATGG